MGDVSIDITEAFLAGIESEAIKERLNAKINRHEPFSEDDMMELAIYPLTYKGKGFLSREDSICIYRRFP